MDYDRELRKSARRELELSLVKLRSLQVLLAGLYAEALSQAVIMTRAVDAPLRLATLMRTSDVVSGERQRLEKKHLGKALDLLRRDGVIDHSEQHELMHLIAYRNHFASDLLGASLRPVVDADVDWCIGKGSAVGRDLERLRSSFARIEALGGEGARNPAGERLRLIDHIHGEEVKRLERRIRVLMSEAQGGERDPVGTSRIRRPLSATLEKGRKSNMQAPQRRKARPSI